MDIIQNCKDILDNHSHIVDGFLNQHVAPEELQLTQSKFEAALRDKHNDLDLIIEQQTYVKGLIDKDDRVISLKRQIAEDKRTIDELRRSCSKIAADSIKNCHIIQQEQSKELERFQLQMMKNIIDDVQRHKRIFEQREHEVASIKLEYEKEEKNRSTLLGNLEKSLEKSIQERRRQLENPSLNPTSAHIVNMTGITSEIEDPNHIELMTVDEYDPYGGLPSRPEQPSSKRRARGAGAGRGAGSTRGRGSSKRGGQRGGSRAASNRE